MFCVLGLLFWGCCWVLIVCILLFVRVVSGLFLIVFWCELMSCFGMRSVCSVWCVSKFLLLVVIFGIGNCIVNKIINSFLWLSVVVVWRRLFLLSLWCECWSVCIIWVVFVVVCVSGSYVRVMSLCLRRVSYCVRVIMRRRRICLVLWVLMSLILWRVRMKMGIWSWLRGRVVRVRVVGMMGRICGGLSDFGLFLLYSSEEFLRFFLRFCLSFVERFERYW